MRMAVCSARVNVKSKVVHTRYVSALPQMGERGIRTELNSGRTRDSVCQSKSLREGSSEKIEFDIHLCKRRWNTDGGIWFTSHITPTWLATCP